MSKPFTIPDASAVKALTEALLKLAQSVQGLTAVDLHADLPKLIPVSSAISITPNNQPLSEPSACMDSDAGTPTHSERKNTGTPPTQLALQLSAMNLFLPPAALTSSWYVVIRGKVPGIYMTHEEATAMVHGVSNFKSHRCNSQAEALTAYRLAWAAELVETVETVAA